MSENKAKERSTDIEKVSQVTETHTAEVYGNYSPKIMLETISAGTAVLLIAITYLTFIPLFYWDLKSTMSGFEDGNRYLSSASCSSQNIYPGLTEGNYGCTVETETEFVWAGHVNNFQNVIAVALQGKLNNISDTIIFNGTKIKDDDFFQEITISYDIELYTCYENTLCGLPPKESIMNQLPLEQQQQLHNSWKLVLQEQNRQFNFGDIFKLNKESAIVQLIPTTFQNQPALPDNGIVISYFIYLTYHKEAVEYQSFLDTSHYFYKFSNVNRDSSIIIRSLLPIFIFITLGIIFGYVSALYRKYDSLRDALPEQRWILYFLIAIVLFQNPVYCVAIWQKEPSTGVVYAVYIFDALSQASFFSIWLFFADGLNRHDAYYSFYLPKVFLGLFIFAVNVVIITLSFPSITSTLSRSPVEAVAMWNYRTKVAFVVFSILFFALLWLWIIWWCVSLYRTAKQLSKYPYMLTRYIQLWFRFFTIQATLLTLYYLCQYAISMNYIAANAPAAEDATAEDVSDSINTLFRQQSLLFGKVIFLTVYALILAFFFIPAGALDKDPHAQTLHIATSSTYTIFEEEIKPIYKLRKKIIKENKAVSSLTNLNPHIFCVNLALELMELSYQTYYDPINYQTISSFGSLNLEKFDYLLPSGYSFHDKDHETICYVFKHKTLNKIVVSFRGTSSKQHWNDNLNFGQKPIDIHSMTLDELDEIDGLDLSCLLLNDNDNEETEIEEGKGGEGRQRAGTGAEEAEVMNEILRESQVDIERKSEIRNSVIFRNISQRRFHVEAMKGVEESDSDSEDEEAEEQSQGARRIEKDVLRALNLAGHGAQAAIALTTDILATAASKTPILKESILSKVHDGFWSAYLPARKFLHELLRKELSANPATLYFTGHSLGGALTTLAAYDISVHTIPRINQYLRAKKRKWMARAHQNGRHPHHHSENVPKSHIRVGMYSFGAPRVGNHNLARDYNIFVPNSFRVVVDGDIVSGVPSSGYKHIGTNVIVDSKGKGSVIIDPSFVEKYLRMSSKTSIGAHSLNVYRRGLKGVKLATLYLNGKLDETQKRNLFALEEDQGGGHHPDGIVLTSTRSKRSTSSITGGAGSTISHRTSSSATLDASMMRIAQESSAYVASCLNQDEEQKDEEEERKEDEEEADPELKRHNQEVTNIDQWATGMQNSTYFERFLIWIGFASDEERIGVDDEDKAMIDVTVNNLHSDPQTETPGSK